MADLTQIVITAQDRTQAAFASVGSKLESIKTSSIAVASSMAGLAGALGVGVMAAWAKETIAAASALDDLADATGASVESLSKLANIARVSGADFGTIDAAVKKLAVGMAGVDEETGKAGKALAALGINTRDPAQAMEELARTFAQFQDGPEKAAYAVAIFGKAGASLLPILKDIAENSQVAGTVTGEMAKEAEKLEKAMRSLSVQAGGFKAALLGEIVPALNEWIDSTRKAHDAGLGWFKSLDIGTTYADRLQPRIEQLAANIEKAKANLKTEPGYDGIMGLFKTTPEELASMNREMAVLLGMLAKAQQGLNADKTDRYLMGQQGAPSGYLARMPKPPSADDNAKVKKAADTWNEFAAAIKAVYENALAWEVAGQQIEKQQADIAAAVADGNTAMAVYVDKQGEVVRAYEDQTDAIGATAEQLNAIELARQAEIRDLRLLAGWGDDAVRIYDEWAAAIGRRNAKLADDAGRAAERKFAEDWARTAERIGDQLTDSFMRAAESGKDFFKVLARDLQNMFSQLVLRPIVQGVLAPLAGGITSSLYGGGVSAQGLGGGGIGSYVQAGQNLFGLGSASSAAYGAAVGFSTSSMGASMGLSAAFTDVAAGGAFATSSVMTGAGTALAGLAAAAPYIAAVVAIAYALYQAFGQEPGGPKVGGYAAAGDIAAWNRTDQFSGGTFMPGHFTPDAMDAALQPVVNEWVKGTAATIKALGGSAVGIGYDLGIDKDPNGDAANRLGIRAMVGGRQVYNYWSGDSALGRDDATLQAAIELESKRALVAALKASDLPAQIAAVFDTVTPETMSNGAIDNLMAFGAAMKSVIDSISGDVLTDATKIWTDAQKDSSDRLRDMGSEVVRLAAEMDGTTESMQALATASQSYRNAVVQVLVAIRSVAQQAQAMQASLVESIQTSGFDSWEQFNYLIGKANALASGLGAATSPEDVGAISEGVYEAISQAFGALPDDAKGAYKEALLGFLSSFGDAVEASLKRIRDQTAGGTESPFAAADAALTSAAAKFDAAASATTSAANTQLQAANIQLQAANTSLQAATTPIVLHLAGSEVNG